MKWNEVESGEYTAHAVSARGGESTAKKTPYIAVRFKIPSLDTHLEWTGYLTEKTMERTLEVMDSLGWDGSDLEFLEGSIDTDKIFNIQVERETGQDGVERPKIAWVNDPDKPRPGFGSDPTPLQGLGLKAHMASLRKGKKKAAAKTLGESAPSFDSDEKLPF